MRREARAAPIGAILRSHGDCGKSCLAFWPKLGGGGNIPTGRTNVGRPAPKFGQSWVRADLTTIYSRVAAHRVDETIHGTVEEHMRVREFCAYHTSTGPPRYATTASNLRQRIATATGVDAGVTQNILHELGLVETTLYRGENKTMERGYKTIGDNFLHALDGFWVQDDHREMFG